MSGSDTPGGPDLAWCHEAVQGVSRTFALTVDALDDPMADHICTGYLLCRVGDTVEDAGHIPAAEAAALLETYDAALDPDDPTTVADFRAAVDGWLPPGTSGTTTGGSSRPRPPWSRRSGRCPTTSGRRSGRRSGR